MYLQNRNPTPFPAWLFAFAHLEKDPCSYPCYILKKSLLRYLFCLFKSGGGVGARIDFALWRLVFGIKLGEKRSVMTHIFNGTLYKNASRNIIIILVFACLLFNGYYTIKKGKININ